MACNKNDIERSSEKKSIVDSIDELRMKSLMVKKLQVVVFGNLTKFRIQFQGEKWKSGD